MTSASANPFSISPLRSLLCRRRLLLPMNRRRVRAEGLLGVEYGRQGLIFDFDQRKGLMGDPFAFRGDEGHGVTHIAHLFAANDGLVGNKGAKGFSPGHVRGRQHRCDPR